MWAALPAAAVDYERIKQIADENGITELRMTEAGGPSGESIGKGYLDPFTEKSGIAVGRENPSGLGKLRAMVEAGAVTSVVLEPASTELEQAKALDLAEPIDWDAVDPMPMFEEAEDPIDISFDEGQLDIAFFVVPKGADANQKAAAMGIFYEMSVPQNQAVAAEVVSYTGNSPDLEPLLPQDRLGEFPTTKANKDVQILANAKWWFENADEVETRWQEFKLGL